MNRKKSDVCESWERVKSRVNAKNEKYELLASLFFQAKKTLPGKQNLASWNSGKQLFDVLNWAAEAGLDVEKVIQDATDSHLSTCGG